MKLPGKKEREEHLRKINEKAGAMSTAFSAVVQGYCTAAFVWGPPGHGKSYMIRRLLDDMAAGSWVHHTGHSTPKGLVLALDSEPDKLHVYEDCEAMLKAELTAGILRAACGAPTDRDRKVTYETAHATISTTFRGGVIIASNSDLSKGSGPMNGVASRFRPVKWSLTHQELVSSIAEMADAGYRKGREVASPKECREVASTLLSMIEDAKLAVPLDLRLYVEHAMPMYLYCRADGQSKWQDALRTKISGEAGTAAEGQAERTLRLESLAYSISLTPGDNRARIEKWKSATGLGQAIYYRHLRNSKSK